MSNYVYLDEDNAPMNEEAVPVRRFYCRFKSICPVKGCSHDQRDECGWYDKFLDRELEAKDIMKELAKEDQDGRD